MGNSIRRVGLLNAVGVGEDEPFFYQLGKKVTIDLSKRQFEINNTGSWSESWTMLCIVDFSTFKLSLTRRGKDEGATGLHIRVFSSIRDEDDKSSGFYGYQLDVKTVTESDALVHDSWRSNDSSTRYRYGKQIHEGGRVTVTEFDFFGAGDTGGLNVLEKKKRKKKEEEPYAVTLAHYFATSGGINDYSRNKTDVGLSVIVKIRATNGNLDITVEGPDQHPAFGLRYLFDEAMRTQIWNPTLCPHCANIQKQRSTMTRQSDSDDSESVPVARRHGRSQKNLRTVDNGGSFYGNDNGNYAENCTKIKNVYYYVKKWW